MKEIQEITYEQGNLLYQILQKYLTETKRQMIEIESTIKTKEAKIYVSNISAQEVDKINGYLNLFFSILLNKQKNGTNFSEEIRKENRAKEIFDVVSCIQKAVGKEVDRLILGQDFLLTPNDHQTLVETKIAFKATSDLQEDIDKIKMALGSLWFSYWQGIKEPE